MKWQCRSWDSRCVAKPGLAHMSLIYGNRAEVSTIAMQRICPRTNKAASYVERFPSRNFAHDQFCPGDNLFSFCRHRSQCGGNCGCNQGRWRPSTHPLPQIKSPNCAVGWAKLPPKPRKTPPSWLEKKNHAMHSLACYQPCSLTGPENKTEKKEGSKTTQANPNKKQPLHPCNILEAKPSKKKKKGVQKLWKNGEENKTKNQNLSHEVQNAPANLADSLVLSFWMRDLKRKR